MRNLIALVGVAASLLGLAACGDDEEGGGAAANNQTNNANNANNQTNNANNQTNNANSENNSAPLAPKVTTFNVGFAKGFVQYATDRVEPVAQALADHDAGVVCLQEVWFQEDIDALINGAEATYPHSFYEKTVSTEVNPGCTPEEVGPLQTCIEANCADVPQDELASCGLASCGAQFNGASSACQTCIASNLDKPIEEIVAACDGGGAKFAYGGHNGLLLLSRYPMTNAEHLLLDSTLVQRSVLRADVELPEYGPVSVYCTHLAADLSAELPYPEDSDFTSFEEEQAAQIDAMLDWADEGEGTVIVLGDMNTGIEVGDASEELPANYQKFVERGWGSAFVGSPEATCTYCASNAVQGGSPDSTLPDGSTGKLIDHIFLKEGLLSTDVAQSARVLDQLQTIETEEGPKELHLSDHFGVQITLQP